MTAHPSLVAVNGRWAGLGNRLRFTLSAQSIAEREGRHFAYVWPTGKGLFEPALTDLWNYNAERLPVGAVMPTITDRPAHFSRKRRLRDLRGMNMWAIHGSSVLRGDGRENPWESLLASLVPVPSIQERVTQVRSQLPPRYAGVQIRASQSSHSATVKASPVSWFVSRMSELIREDAQLQFFLSCDDDSVTREVQRAVPNVHALNDKGRFNSLEGVRSAVVDLYLLSASTHLIGPYYSSFVELAWILGGRRQVLENSVHRLRPHDGVRARPVVQASAPYFNAEPSDVSAPHADPAGSLVPYSESDLFVRNPLLVAWSRTRASRRSTSSR